MQVNSQIIHQKTTAPEAPLELKQGEVYSASIKEKVNNSEAILHIRGKDVGVKFADGVPATGGRITVMVNGQSDGLVDVKTIAVESSKTVTGENKVHASLGLTEKEPTVVKQAVNTLLEKGAPLTKEIVVDLKKFMTEGKDTVQSKMETVRALANKKLEATGPQLRAVHEALHGKPLNEVLSNLAKEIDPNFKLEKPQNESLSALKPSPETHGAKEVTEQANVQKEPAKIPLSKDGRTEVIADNKTQATSMNKENPLIKNTSEVSELIRKGIQLVEKEPNLKKALQQIREEIVKNPKVDGELATKIDKAAQEAEKLQSIGKERLLQALKNVEATLQKQEQQSRIVRNTEIETNHQPVKRSEAVKNITVEVSKNPNLNQSIKLVKEQLAENPSLPKELSEKVNQALSAAGVLAKQGRITAGKATLNQALTEVQNTLQQTEQQIKSDQNSKGLSSEIVKGVRAEVQQEPNLQKAVEKVRDQVLNNPKMDREVTQKVDQALKEIVSLQKVGQESAGRERLQQTLAKAEVELKQIENRQPVQQTQNSSTNEPRPSEVVKNVKAEVQQEPDLQKAVEKVRDQVVNNPKMDREVVQKIEQAIKETVMLEKVGQESAGREKLQQALTKAEAELKQIESRQPVQQSQVSNTTEPRSSEVVKNVRTEVQQEPDLQKAIEKVRDQIVNNPKIDREVAQKVDQVIKETVSLQKVGQESAGRERLQQALTRAEIELKQIESRQQAPASHATEPRPSEVIKNVRAEVQQESNLQKAVEKVHDQVVNNLKIDREVAQKVEQAIKETVSLQKLGQESVGRERLQQALTKAEVDLRQIESRQLAQQGQLTNTTEPRPSEVVKNVRSEIQQEPNLQKAVEKVQDHIIHNPKINHEVTQKVEQSVKEALTLQKVGQESVGHTRLQQTLANAETELTQTEQRQRVQPTQPSQEPNIKEAIQKVQSEIQTEADTKKIVSKAQDLVSNLKNSHPELTRNIERFANQANQLDQAARDRLTNMLHQAEATIKHHENPVTQQVENTTKQTEEQTKVPEANPKLNVQAQPETLKTQQKAMVGQQESAQQSKIPESRSSETMKQALKIIGSEPNMDLVFDKIQKEIAANPNIDLKTVDKVEKAIDGAQQLQDKGREMAARQQLTKELIEIQQDLAKTEPRPSTEQQSMQNAPQYDVNEMLQSLSIQSKDILVTKVTQKLAQATHDFRELKREITRNLDNVERVINTFKKNAYPQAKQMLENTISKLDNAILKSEMMLFTDMKTEKQLMQASGQLAEAKKLLSKGNHAEASKIVHEVKSLVDKMIFNPSQQKIVHYVNKESMMLDQPSPTQQMLSQFSEAANGATRPEFSARQMYETVRSLGLNYESEIANTLVFHKNDQPSQEQQQNLKAALMKLVQGEGQETQASVSGQAEQALNNLTGQQLLSKSDSSGSLQSMFFNLPLMLGEKLENLQVFINSKNEGEQVEWENCNLYFLLETKKLGDIGILLNSTDRNLSVTIKNDTPGFKERMEPLANLTKEKLEEVGYSVSGIQFKRMTSDQTVVTSHEELGNEINGVKMTTQILNGKGLNFTI